MSTDHPHPLSVNMVVSFFAATVFCALMCAFWWYIASQEMSQAVKRKAELLHTTRQKLGEEAMLRDLAAVLDARVHQMHRMVEPVAAQEEAYRMFQNGNVMRMWMGPIVAAYAGLLASRMHRRHERTLDGGHRVQPNPHTLRGQPAYPILRPLGRFGARVSQLRPRNLVLPVRDRMDRAVSSP